MSDDGTSHCESCVCFVCDTLASECPHWAQHSQLDGLGIEEAEAAGQHKLYPDMIRACVHLELSNYHD